MPPRLIGQVCPANTSKVPCCAACANVARVPRRPPNAITGGVARLWWRQYFPSLEHYSHLAAIFTSPFHYHTTRTTSLTHRHNNTITRISCSFSLFFSLHHSNTQHPHHHHYCTITPPHSTRRTATTPPSTPPNIYRCHYHCEYSHLSVRR